MRLRSGHVLLSICVVGLTFVAVPMLMGTSVFTGNTMWEVGMPPLLAPKVYAEEDEPASIDSVAHSSNNEEKPQEASRSSQEALPLINPQPSAYPLQTTKSDSGEEGKDEELVNRIANDIQRDLVVVTVFTGVFQLVILAVQVWIARAATRYAGDAAKAAKESVEVADRSMKIANRAYLFVKEWEIIDFRENTQSTIRCCLQNAGCTPATIEKRMAAYDITKEAPPPLTPVVLYDAKKGGFVVNAQGESEVVLASHSFTTDDYQALHAKVLFLHVAVCFIYRDVFDQQHWVVSSARYDVKERTFMVIDRPGYNVYRLYQEEDWIHKKD